MAETANKTEMQALHTKGLELSATDPEKGIALTPNAAEADFPEAMVRLYWVEKLYEFRKRTLGEKHPKTFEALRNLAVAYDRIGDYTKASEFSLKMYNISSETLGVEHKDTVEIWNYLQYCLKNADKQQKK